MVKVSIKDQSIGIKPSEKLIDFIKSSLNDVSIDLPENLLKVYEAFTQDIQKRNIYKQPIPTEALTEEERKLLIALSDDTFQNTTDLQKCLESLSVYTCHDDENNSNSEIEEIVSTGGERISKNKARQIRAKQREKELSKLTLNLSDLKWLHQYLLVLPSNEYTERNPELEARCQRLKREQDDLIYRLMTKNVDCSRSHEPEETISYQVKQINRQLIAVINFLFSIAAGFAFGFIGIELLVGNLDFGFRLLLGIICSLIVALAEIYLLAKKLNEEIDEAEQATHGQAKKSNVTSGSRVENLKEHND
ncbi:transmembrane protein 199 isoform X2 [Sitodiplosis mosellana]|uniref:transmembrane protein 199 isoform X2 n=1 Tax=Sitodiplosis mosellana TaxID=263140 RepID=UPI0024452859|nr:transmembrane protein 199 isoform X2 [Sitodiplosis mosellana]